MKRKTATIALILLLAMVFGAVSAFADTNVEVICAKQYGAKSERFNADIQVPAIKGLVNEELENALNSQYLSEGKRFFKEFKQQARQMKKGEGFLGAYSGFLIQTKTDSLLSLGRYFLWVQASGAESRKYDTIDLEKGIWITLPSLFVDESYLDVISDNIREQMQERMDADEGVIYWIDEFEGISENQQFYITKEGKLVISFDEYAVAPGYMGVVEFTIPTEVIQDILVSNEYVK